MAAQDSASTTGLTVLSTWLSAGLLAEAHGAEHIDRAMAAEVGRRIMRALAWLMDRFVDGRRA